MTLCYCHSSDNKSKHLISEYIKGTEKIWIIGDDFGFQSFNKYFYEQDHSDHYIMESYKVSGFNNDKNLSYDRNVISCMRNNLVGAIREQPVLPKLIAVVLDDDIIEYFMIRIKEKKKRPDKTALISAFSRLLKWLMCQYDRQIKTQKEWLPKKAKKDDQPRIIWIIPPSHTNMRNNTQREAFGEALQNTTEKYDRHYAVALKKIWDENDPTLFSASDLKYSSEGFKLYWNAVDKAIKYVDTLLIKKEVNKKNRFNKPNNFKSSPRSTDRRRHDTTNRKPRQDKYHWHRINHRR